MSLIQEAREVHRRIAARLAELEPLVREYEELRRAAAELGIDPAEEPLASAPAPERAPAARRPATRRSGTRRSAPRRAAPEEAAPPRADGDELSERVLEAVRNEPGQTVADYARTLEVAATALYRPVRELTTAGEIVKRNRQLYPS